MASTNQTWSPEMTYRGQRERAQWEATNELEDYADSSIIPHYRIYSPHPEPNHDYSGRVKTAVSVSNTIDLVDGNPYAMDQVIWGITHPDDCHPGVKSIVENQSLIDLLLIRHFKAHGGIALPPLKSARDSQATHEIIAAQEAAQGRTWSGPNGRTMVHYPLWLLVKNTAGPPGFATRGSSATRGGRGGGNVARGRGSIRGGYVGTN